MGPGQWFANQSSSTFILSILEFSVRYLRNGKGVSLITAVINPLLQRLAEPSARTSTVLLKAFGDDHASWNHSCVVWLDDRLHEGKEGKTRLERQFQCRVGIAMGAGPRSLDIVSLEFGSHQ